MTMAEQHDRNILSCINCSALSKVDQCGPADLSHPRNALKFFREIRVPLLFNGTNDTDQEEEDRIITVYDALSSIFNLQHLLTGEKFGSRSSNNNNFIICSDCGEVLANLYKFYVQFSHLRQANSVLAQHLHDLETLLNKVDHLSTPGRSHLDNDDDDVQDVIIESSPVELDDDNFDIEFCDIEANFEDVNDDLLSSSNNKVTTTIPSASILGPGPRVNLVRMTPAQISEATTTTTTRINAIVTRTDHTSGSFSSPEDTDDDDEEFNYHEVNQKFPKKSSHSHSRLRRDHHLYRNKKQIHHEKIFKCSICDKNFSRADGLRIHNRIHTNEKPYICPICGAKFSQNSAFHHHRRRTHPDEKVFLKPIFSSSTHEQSCSLTSLTMEQSHENFAKKRYKSAHAHFIKKEKNIKREWKCSICVKKFSRADGLRIHNRIHTNEKPYICPLCGAKFSQNCVFHKHRRRVHPEVSFLKPILSRTVNSPSKNFTEKEHASSNLESKSDDDDHVTKKSKNVNQQWKCTICDKIFTRVDGLRNHHRGVHEQEKPYSCPICGQRFSQNCAFHHHRRRMHPDEKVHVKPIFSGRSAKSALPKTLKNTTDNCDLFKNPKSDADNSSDQQNHSMHNRVKPFSCSLCDKKYCLSSALRFHQKKVHGRVVAADMVSQKSEGSSEQLNRCLCPICGVTFAYKSRLDAHMLVHEDARNFTCKNCPMSFKNMSNLKRHERVHADVRPLLCTECGKSFTGTQGLRIHMQTHTGEKPYKCKLCGEDFGYNQTLKKHIVRHHGQEFLSMAGISRTEQIQK